MDKRHKKRWYKRVWIYILLALALLGGFLAAQFTIDIKKAYARLDAYPAQSFQSEYGEIDYVERGSGEAVLLCHGIFGGYDQAITSLDALLGDGYRKIAPSRFGYPGSDLPDDPTPQKQAQAFAQLLDHLGVERAYVIATSAGGASALSFALAYPERVKGLILLSSGVPSVKKERAEITGMMGPPAPLINDFPMWLSTKYFGFVFASMFGSQVDAALYETLLPVVPRKRGIAADTEITNVDMLINYGEYPVEEITAPILVLHAKDDPMAKFEDVERFLARVDAKTVLFKTGGHLITGHGSAVSDAIAEFIGETSGS